MKQSLIVAGLCAGLIVPFLAVAQDSSKIIAMPRALHTARNCRSQAA